MKKYKKIALKDLFTKFYCKEILLKKMKKKQLKLSQTGERDLCQALYDDSWLCSGLN